MGSEMCIRDRMCTDQKDIYVDIRRYTEQNATVEGIQLDRTQWTSLKRAIKHIDYAFNSTTTKKKTVLKKNVFIEMGGGGGMRFYLPQHKIFH